jgi:hypothetical protein
MSGLPVHFKSCNVCASANSVIDASVVAKSIAAFATVSHLLASMDCSEAEPINIVAKHGVPVASDAPWHLR